MKTKATVDEALTRLSRAIDRPWDNGSLPSYADTPHPLTRFLTRWTKPSHPTHPYPTEDPDLRPNHPTPHPKPRALIHPSTPTQHRRPTKPVEPARHSMPAHPSASPHPTSAHLSASAHPTSAHLSSSAQQAFAHPPASAQQTSAHPPASTHPTSAHPSASVQRTSDHQSETHPTRSSTPISPHHTWPSTPASPDRTRPSTSASPDPTWPATSGSLTPGPTAQPDLPPTGTRVESNPTSAHVGSSSHADYPDPTDPEYSPQRPDSSHEHTKPADPDFDSDFVLDPANEVDVTPARRRLPRAAAIVAVVLGALLAGVLAIPGSPETPAAPPPALPVDQPKPAITVDIQGKVKTPGVRQLPTGSRVIDALTASGGPLPGTDTSTLNLARRLVDGEQIHVGTTPPPAALNSSTPPLTNLNTAPVYQLDALPGVGIVTAQRIVEYRTRTGGFTDINQLRQIEGIGPTRFDKLKDLVTV